MENQNKILTTAIFFLLIFLQVGCHLITRRSELTAKDKPVEISQPEVPKVEGQEVAPKMPTKSQNVGIILGPGGVKAFAHLGVLKELERAKIPVKAIVGLEMGSLVAAFYAASANANEAEWKLSKLKEEDLFERGLFLAKEKKGSLSHILEFTKKELGQRNIDELGRPWGCISISMTEEKPTVTDSGPIGSALKNCLPYPPLFWPSSAVVAGVTEIKAAADFLRLHGMDLVIFVNVIAEGKFLRDEELLSQAAIGNLWIQIRKNLKELESVVDYVVSVNTKTIGLLDFSYFRGLINLGANQGRQHAHIISNKYGF